MSGETSSHLISSSGTVGAALRAKVPYLNWRNGRPRWVPGPMVRARGYRGVDLKDDAGKWLDLEDAMAEAVRLNTQVSAGRTRVYKSVDARSFTAEIAQANLLKSAGRPKRLPAGEYVYVFVLDGRYAKIGFSTNPHKRWAGISDGLPLGLAAVLVAMGTRHDEIALHEAFGDYALKNEWFRVAGELALWLEQCARLKK